MEDIKHVAIQQAYVLDTQKGVAWEMRNGRFETVASMPW